MSEKDFVIKIAPYAMKDAEASGILASRNNGTRPILESGYGSTDLAVNANNIFGMKCSLSGKHLEKRLGRHFEIYEDHKRTEEERRRIFRRCRFPRIPGHSSQHKRSFALLAGRHERSRKTV